MLFRGGDDCDIYIILRVLNKFKTVDFNRRVEFVFLWLFLTIIIFNYFLYIQIWSLDCAGYVL